MATSSKLSFFGVLGVIGMSVLACGGEPEANTACERTEARVCDSKDARKVYYMNTCGNAEEIEESCIGKYTCIASSPTEASCGDASVQCTATDTRVCDPNEPRKVYRVDTCGDKKAEDTCIGDNVHCTTISATEASCLCDIPESPRLGCAAEGYAKIDNPTELGPVDACDRIVEITQTCMMGERCWWDFDDQGMAISDPFCATSINPRHRAEPFYAMGCDTSLYMAAQTDLPIDCRCNRSNMALQECRPAPDAWNNGLRLGSGPHTRGINLQKWGGGFLSKSSKELFAVVQYVGGNAGNIKPGALYAFNYETGDRRVVSGSYIDDTGRHDVGSGYTPEGEILPFAVNAKLGADGNIYVNGSDTLNNVEITRVNPANGERTLVWRRQTVAEGMNANFPFGQCFSGRVSPSYIGGFDPVQNAERAFALAPDGGFYLAWKNDGVGVVHISPDGSTCSIVSRWASRNTTAPLPDIGGGVTPQYGTISGMLYRNGIVYAETKDILLTIDVVTGDRGIFSNVSGIGGIGETNFFVDEANKHFFACGTVSSRKCSVHDLDDGNNAQGLFQIGSGMPVISGKYGQIQGAKGALDNNNFNGFGAVAQDPDDANILYFIVDYAFIKYEIDTGNSYIISI
jgi:hypothetical protein